MKILKVESYMSDYDLQHKSDYDRELDPPKAKKQEAGMSYETLLDKFKNYVNHSRGTACITADGRMVPNAKVIENYLQSFKKAFNVPDFELHTDVRYYDGEYATFII